MSFLDRVTKAVKEGVEKASEAVSEVVGEAKEDLERMSKVRGIRGEIREQEKEIEGLEKSIQDVKVQLGEKAMAMLKDGTLDDPELKSFVEQVEGFEKQIVAHRDVIAEKEAAIEQIKAEEEAAKQAKAEAKAEVEAEAEAEAAEATATCPGCGASVPEGSAFCPNCGAKIGE